MHCWKQRARNKMVSLLTEGFLSFNASTTSSWKPATEVYVEGEKGEEEGEEEGEDERCERMRSGRG